MLQLTDEYKEFAKFGLDDNGLLLLTQANKKHKSKYDLQNGNRKGNKFHYCSCNK